MYVSTSLSSWLFHLHYFVETQPFEEARFDGLLPRLPKPRAPAE